MIPRGVFAATAALSISPVARWHRQYSSLIIGDWVPLPDPGGPTQDEKTYLHCHGKRIMNQRSTIETLFT